MECTDRHRTKSSITELQARGDLFTRQLIQEKRRLGQLQARLGEANDRIAELRAANKRDAMRLLNKHTTTPRDAHHRVDGVNPTVLAENNQRKVVRTLEGRLGKALLRRNQTEGDNAAIKARIDKLRRKIHNDVQNRAGMEREMTDIRECVDDVMKRAAAVATERERLIERRNQILREDREKQAQFEEEYDRLRAFIAQRANSLEESIVKAADGVLTQLTADDGTGGAPGRTAADAVEDIPRLREKAAALGEEYAAAQKTLKENQAKIRHFEEKFRELREVSSLSSTEDIIDTFVKNEDECFSIFNYIQAVNQDCDKTIEEATKSREGIHTYTREQREMEKARAATMHVYTESLQEVQEEREQLYQTAIQSRRTTETIARRVTALYFRLKCHELKQDGLAAKDSSPVLLMSDRKLTTIGGGELSERNMLNLMESIENRSIQIVDAYLKNLPGSSRSKSRPALILSPKLFEKVKVQRRDSVRTIQLSEESDEEEEYSSDDDDEEFGRPMSVYDIRREAAVEAAVNMRPCTATSAASAASGPRLPVVSSDLPRHTII